MAIAIISGSGFYDFPGLSACQDLTIDTPFAEVVLQVGQLGGQQVYFLARHGRGHQQLSHQVPHLAHFKALAQLQEQGQLQAVIGLSVVGVVNPELPLGQLLLPSELHFPDNRLPTGEACTLFTTPGEPGRGHLIMERHFNPGLGQQLQAAAEDLKLPLHAELTYGYVQGPRFNSRSEIRALAQLGVDMLSQTLGPEAVLAGELELPYAALCFGVDYANGVQAEPTPLETLSHNLQASKQQLTAVLTAMLQQWQPPPFAGFVFRFD